MHSSITHTYQGNSFLFYGDYSFSGTAQRTKIPYGVYIDKEAANYFSGNVGIGRDNPNEKLEVNGKIKANGLIINTGTLPTSGDVLSAIDGTGELEWSSVNSDLQTEINQQGALITQLTARITALEPPPPAIGDYRDGGIVFWVNPDDNTKGLVCAIEDQSVGIQWHKGSNVTTNASRQLVGTGKSNTTQITTKQGLPRTSYAAGVASNYSGGGFTDWFLPSQEELHQMLLNKVTTNTTATANGGQVFASSNYWTSTEYDQSNARCFNLSNGGSYNNSKNTTNRVRAVKAF